VVPQLSRALGVGDYDSIFATLATLGGPIDRYFTEVLVNAPDLDVRRERLAFLAALHALFARFGDLSRLVGLRT
jgi:glycyl-tRNA synthetase beta chain